MMNVSGAAPIDTTQSMASRFDWVLLVLLSISLVTNAIFGVVVIRGSDRAQSPSPAGPEVLSSGTQLPPLEARTPTGDLEVVGFAEEARPTLLYVYAPSCTWCARNIENVKALFAAATRTHRIVALSLAREGGADAQIYQQYGQVLLQPARTAVEAYRMGATPMTVMISPDGKVLKVWTGAYVGQTREEVEKHFAIRLPGAAAR